MVGGLGRYAERILAAFQELGTPIVAYGATGHRRTAGTTRTGDVTVHLLRTVGVRPGARTPRPLSSLARIAGLLAFNVVVAARILRNDAGRTGSVVAVHDWMGCLTGILCRLLGRRPVVFHVHTREILAGRSRRRGPVAAGIALLETAQARLARLILVPSQGMRAQLAAQGWPVERLRVVPHGFEDPELLRLAGLPGSERDQLRDRLRRRYLPGGSGSLLVYAGRLSSHKGVRTLVRTAPLLRDRPEPVRIVVIGAQAPRTDDNAEVAQLIAEVGGGQVTADFEFSDPAEVFAHFLAADVCVFPSTYEPFGLVAVEAMALARPVVVGPGYSPEVVGDAALRCERDSPEELAAALRRCLDDPAWAAQLAERAAARVRQRYTWSGTAQRTLACYGEAALATEAPR